MDSIPIQVEPVLRDQTGPVRGQTLREVIIWCSGNGQPHHWRTSYQFSEQTVTLNSVTYNGISLDMFQPRAHEYNPSSDNLYGSLRMDLRPANKLISTKAGFVLVLPLKTAVTVQDVVSLVLYHGLQYYKFNPTGSGCLFWQEQLLRQFVTMRWLDQQQLDEFLQKISAYAKRRGSGYVPYPPVQGEFYSPPH